MRKRYLLNAIVQDLQEKIVIIVGPRQVGKTTLARYIGKRIFEESYEYLNWDWPEDREKILSLEFMGNKRLLIFDEIHKYKKWKTLIKGLFDKYSERFKILLTGSSRLDVFRKGGEAMTGRYFSYTLHPFSLREAVGKEPAAAEPLKEVVGETKVSSRAQETLSLLEKLGGFPEPFLRKSEDFWRKWQRERKGEVLKREIRDVALVREISDLEALVEVLPHKVGSLLSIESLREDFGVAHKTMGRYLRILESLYFHFSLYPFVSRPLRSLKKRQKIYLWDWSQVKDRGARFENLIASHLLKFVHFLRDTRGYEAELYYLRDREGREVDFLVVIEGKPWFAVEAKLQEEDVRNLLYFGERLRIPYLYQVVRSPGIDKIKKGVRVLSAEKFLLSLV